MLPDDDVTDRRYQPDDRKKFIAGQLDAFTKTSANWWPKWPTSVSETTPPLSWINTAPRTNVTKFKKPAVKRKQVLVADSVPITESLTTKIRLSLIPCISAPPEYLIGIYHYYADHEGYPDPHAAAALKERGERALASSNYDELKVVINRLYALLPREEQAKAQHKRHGHQFNIFY